MQFEPTRNSLIEAGYIGSRTVRQRATVDFDSVPRQYLSTSLQRDQAAIDYLGATVANPFRGIDGFQGSSYYNAVNTTRSQLIRPYPHFSSVATGLPAGFSWYHALTLRFERRFSKGLQVSANYTRSKTMEALNYLNPTDIAPEHVVANIDRPGRLVLSGIGELPFGKGKWIGRSAHGALNQMIGGWQVQTLVQMQTGPPLSFGNVLFRGLVQDIPLPADRRTLERWFNTDGFERRSGQQLNSNIRAFPSRLAGARAAGINLLDFSLFKNFPVYERIKLQLRGEAEGLLNHPNFAAPNTSPTSTLFGQIAGTQTGQEERRVFVGLKLIF